MEGILNKHAYLYFNDTHNDNIKRLCRRLIKYKNKNITFNILSCLDIMQKLDNKYYYSYNFDDNNYKLYKQKKLYIYYHEMNNNGKNINVFSYRDKCKSCILSYANINHYHTKNYTNLLNDDKDQFGEMIHIIHIENLYKHKNELTQNINERLIENCCEIKNININSMVCMKSLNILKKIDL